MLNTNFIFYIMYAADLVALLHESRQGSAAGDLNIVRMGSYGDYVEFRVI